MTDEAKNSPDAQPNAAEHARKSAAGDSLVSRVLVVDDEERVRTVLCDVIRQAGHACSGACGAKEALAFLDREPVDVVITDIIMPGCNGLELTETIKEKYNSDVIIITGYGDTFSYEEALEKGASDFAQKPVRPEELIARLKRVLNERKLIGERRQMEKRLRELTLTDNLTKLFNSRHFFEQIQSEIDRAARYNHPLSLLLLDIDGFKHFNDTYGHLEGDKVLLTLGEIIRGCMRKNDTGYRYGGDEFTAILPMTHGQEAVTVAERIRQEFCAAGFTPEPGQKFTATVSVGIAERQQEEGWEELTKRADKAMYMAKKDGGNRTHLLD